MNREKNCVRKLRERRGPLKRMHDPVTRKTIKRQCNIGLILACNRRIYIHISQRETKLLANSVLILQTIMPSCKTGSVNDQKHIRNLQIIAFSLRNSFPLVTVAQSIIQKLNICSLSLAFSNNTFLPASV